MTEKYHIYGIGNALVDFEIETTSSELSGLSVDKGVMTLIEEARQSELMQAFKGKHHSQACGGSAANTIIGAQSLGSRCFYSCKVADDSTGHFYRDDLLAHGVDSNLASAQLEPGKTGKCLVMITEDADRTMNTFLGITGDIDYHQVVESALANSEILYIEGYLSSAPMALSAAERAMQFAKQKQIKTAFSLSDPNMVKFCRAGLESIIGDGVDYLFCNFDEATLFTQTDTVEAASESLLEIAKTVIITLGEKGAKIATEGGSIEIAGHSVKAVDTNGAGDLFAGSFLHAIGQGFSLEQAGKLASFASAKLVTQFGPRLNDSNLNEVKLFEKGLLNTA